MVTQNLVIVKLSRLTFPPPSSSPELSSSKSMAEEARTFSCLSVPGGVESFSAFLSRSACRVPCVPRVPSFAIFQSPPSYLVCYFPATPTGRCGSPLVACGMVGAVLPIFQVCSVSDLLVLAPRLASNVYPKELFPHQIAIDGYSQNSPTQKLT